MREIGGREVLRNRWERKVERQGHWLQCVEHRGSRASLHLSHCPCHGAKIRQTLQQGDDDENDDDDDDDES
jgi:hypothetical protein